MRETDDFGIDAEFGKWLSQLRKKSQQTIEQVATLTGIAAERIKGLELGYSERGINHREANALCKIYQVPIDELLKRASGE